MNGEDGNESRERAYRQAIDTRREWQAGLKTGLGWAGLGREGKGREPRKGLGSPGHPRLGLAPVFKIETLI